MQVEERKWCHWNIPVPGISSLVFSIHPIPTDVNMDNYLTTH